MRDRPRAAAAILGGLAVATMIALVMAPWLRDLSTFGFHDWDAQTSHRYLVLTSLLRHHELPGWNPYACGGFPAWGYVEADTILVSPFLPAYLLLPLSVALRVEVIGMAVLGAAGAWAAASRYTESRAARALVAVLWAVNGRWALQAAAGHTWHLAYAFMPWCLFFFERARLPERRVLDLAGGGVAIAMLVYAGGIYPLPHTVLLLGVYASLLALTERSARPLVTLAILGVLGVGLSAPKLLPLLDGFRKAPRLIESTESLDLGSLVTLLTSHDQAFYSRPAPVRPYGWHEWGMYIGAPGALVLLAGILFVQGRREAVLKAVGMLFLVLGFGAFHPEAPWALLHKHAPVFRSQHVPSRFLYTAVLVFGLVAAAGIGRFVARRRASLPWLDAALAVALFPLAVDIALVAQKPMAAAMWMVPPSNIPQNRAFHFEQDPPFQYKRRDWAGPMYLAMLGNTGVINCYGTPPFDRKGARPLRSPDYRGEAHVVLPDGARSSATAKVVGWSPNHVDIQVDGAEAGSLLVYNMNFDEGWRSSTGSVVAHHDAVATRLGGGAAKVTFSYRPPYLGAGVLVGALTLGALVVLRRRERAETVVS
ncbi:Hypothetical protein A7982_01721 [Minicystis rosea]|nr:Hypothetical protein A7982_01721 [Minicystis rosea]